MCAVGRQEREQESREQQRQVAILQEEARKTNASLREACERVSIRRGRARLRRPALLAPLGTSSLKSATPSHTVSCCCSRASHGVRGPPRLPAAPLHAATPQATPLACAPRTAHSEAPQGPACAGTRFPLSSRRRHESSARPHGARIAQ